MRKFSLTLLATSALFAAAPASAAALMPGSLGVQPTSGLPAGQGTLLASNVFTGSALTFSGIFHQAVYRNAGGTLDFYFQVAHTGAGSMGANNEISGFTVSNFANYAVDGFAFAGDPDGAGIFIPANNPTLTNGRPSGSTTTYGRSVSGVTLRTDFGLNGLDQGQVSATYVFRTNAADFNNLGTFGIIDGSTLQGMTFAPTGAPVPEPATWAMMLAGFGAVGFASRRRQRIARTLA